MSISLAPALALNTVTLTTHCLQSVEINRRVGPNNINILPFNYASERLVARLTLVCHLGALMHGGEFENIWAEDYLAKEANLRL